MEENIHFRLGKIVGRDRIENKIRHLSFLTILYVEQEKNFPILDDFIEQSTK